MQKEDFKITNINQKYSKTKERNVTSKTDLPSYNKYLETQRLFPKLKEGGNTISARALQEHLLKGGLLSARDVLLIVTTATKVLQSESNVIYLDVPVNICGDINGQIHDLSKLFEVGGPIDTSNYLFLGNYCHSGNLCVETLTFLYALKILNRNRLILTRGNADSQQMCEFSDLKRQCLARYGADVYAAVLASFAALPLAAVVNRQFFCVHGGLSPELKSVNDVNKVNRFRETPPFGLMTDLLWAEPAEEYAPTDRDHFSPNLGRQCSYEFTYFAACEFLEKNKLLSVVRAGEPLEGGFKMLSSREATGFPTVISIYSAPNLLGVGGNKGAILHYDKSELNIRQFTESGQSGVVAVTKVRDAFSWSLPFVTQKTVDLVLGLFKMCLDDNDENSVNDEDKMNEKSLEELKLKIKFWEEYKKTLERVRDVEEASETVVASLGAKGVVVDTTYLGAKAAYVSRDNITSFKEAVEFDAPNRARPVCEFNQELLDNINNGVVPEPDEDDDDDEDGSYSTDDEDYEDLEEN